MQALQDLSEQAPGNSKITFQLARALEHLADLDLEIGSVDAALERRWEILDLYELLRRKDPDHPEWLAGHSIGLVKVGNAVREKQPELGDQGMYKRALEIDLELVERFPDNAHFQDNLFWSYERLEHVDKLIPQAEKLLALDRERAPSRCCRIQAWVEKARSLNKDDPAQAAQATELLERAAREGKAILEKWGTRRDVAAAVLLAYQARAADLSKAGKHREAEEALEEALTLGSQFVEAEPYSVDLQEFQAGLLLAQASLARTTNEWPRELQFLKSALLILEELVKSAPHRRTLRTSRLDAYQCFAHGHCAARNFPDAEHYAKLALQELRVHPELVGESHVEENLKSLQGLLAEIRSGRTPQPPAER